ncbi:MAG: glycosyltransferase family 2 protein, partial [Comamonadaceae bacterium]
FLRTQQSYTGAIVFGTPGIEPAYQSGVERLIPIDCRARVERMPGTEDPQREALLRGATVVIPATWDAFCTVAYEASLLGARLILNETNPAFGVGTPWTDGVNCLKFDGSVFGLTQALRRNIERNELLRPVEYPVRPLPWLQMENRRAPWHRLDEQPLVSVVIAHHNLGAYLPQTLASLRQQSHGAIEIVLVDDASTDRQSLLVIEALALAPDRDLKLIRLPGNVGLAATRNIGVRHATGQYVLTLDADDLIHPDFIAIGVESLENRPAFDVVVPQTAYFLDGETSSASSLPVEFVDYLMFCGEASVGGLVENRFSTATALFRKSALARFPYDESLNCYEDWSLYLRMCEAGVRFIVTNDVFFYYRRRSDSMVHTP